MVNSDRGHAVSWLAFEHEKPGYVPAGHSVVVAQMAHEWSAPRLGEPDGTLAAEAWAVARTLIPSPAPAPLWYDVARWPAALPDVTIAPDVLAVAEADGLYFAGDVLTGGRLQLALLNGLATGHRVGAALDR